MDFTKEDIVELSKSHPILDDVMQLKPVCWINPHLSKVDAIKSTDLGREDVERAESLWHRFAQFLKKAFPELQETDGIIESPLKKISNLQNHYTEISNHELPGEFYLKCDNELPVAGSIKARGGFYEVLHYAEKLALQSGMITSNDHYEKFAEPELKAFFSKYTIGVGSTGNLGLSIGIISAELGFRTEVFMSHDAKQWKKNLLREKGAEVYEFSGDFSKAITQGRERIKQTPNAYFVDDEDSMDLYLGYATAGIRLAKQLVDQNITVDAEHPLFLYLPCGVGGSPGGITFGVKQILGDHVHCFFVEPLHTPSVLTGLVTQYMSDISVNDIGLDNKTEADGLAVGRPSRCATKISDELISGIYTISDDRLYQLLAFMVDTEGIHLEPSAAAGLIGPDKVLQTEYIKQHHIQPENITHIAWATGGLLVPELERREFYERGKSLSK